MMKLDRLKKHLPWMTLLALVLIVGIAVELLFFGPIERRMMRQRGLTGAR